MENFDHIGYVVVASSLLSMFFMYKIHKAMPEKPVKL